MNQNYFEPNYSGFDQPPQYSINYQPSSIQENLNQQKIYELLQMMQSFCEKLLQQKQAANIDQSPLQEMSIQEMEDLKQHYLDEMLSLSNDLQIKDYLNEKIDIRFRRECESYDCCLSTYPSQRFQSFCYDDDDDYDYEESSIPLRYIISKLPLSVDLITIPEKESNEVIKSSVEDLVLIPSESEDTSGSDSNCDLPSCNNFSPINISEEKSDVLEDNVKIYSNPLFKFDDEYISSDINPLFDEVIEDIECKASYDSNLDEPALLVTPLFVFNEDKCFESGGDVDVIELLLHRDPSTPKISIASILEGFTDEPPLKENDALCDLESKENEWKKILYDAPIDDLMTEDKVFDPGILKKIFSPTYVRLPFEDRHYLSLTYVI
ncbi:hypothetical protein Tco_0093702 [Tanacetum coccineum]